MNRRLMWWEKKNDTAIKSDEVNRNWCGSKALRLLFVLSFSLQFYFIDASDKLFSEFLKLNFPSIRSSKSVTGISTFMYLIHSKTTTTTIILKYPFSEIHWKNKRKNMQKKKKRKRRRKIYLLELLCRVENAHCSVTALYATQRSYKWKCVVWYRGGTW